MLAKLEVCNFSHFGAIKLLPTFRKRLSGVMSGLSLGTRLPNLKFIALAILELLAFNTQKFMGSRDPDHAHFSETFVRVMLGLSLGAGRPNLKIVSLAVSELLAFNAQKIYGVT